MAPNFFFLLLASMYLVLYMDIKTLGTSCNKTAFLLFCGLWRIFLQLFTLWIWISLFI
jgi:hypothetical protein